MRAYLNLRLTVPERQRVFRAGLKRLGYKIVDGLTMTPDEGDILCTWNRIRTGNDSALAFEQRGLPVLVTENATWGNEFAGERWYTLANNYHNTAGCFPCGHSSRWDDLNVRLDPWRTEGETVILPQRGIGSPPTAMPRDWIYGVRSLGRVRNHPGTFECPPIEEDLADCGHVVTWGSGAAIKALMMGIPVTSHMPNWIGQCDNDDASRLDMFRRLAWAQWRLSEFESGEAFARMLS